MQQLVFYILFSIYKRYQYFQLIYMESNLRSIARVSYYCPLLSRCFIKKEETGKTGTRVILLWRFYRKYTETGGASRGRDCLEKPFGWNNQFYMGIYMLAELPRSQNCPSLLYRVSWGNSATGVILCYTPCYTNTLQCAYTTYFGVLKQHI